MIYISIYIYLFICIRWRSQGSRFGWIPRKSLMMIGLMMSTVRIMRRFLRRKSWSPFLQKKSSYVGCKVFTWWLRWRQPVEGTEIGHPLSCVLEDIHSRSIKESEWCQKLVVLLILLKNLEWFTVDVWFCLGPAVHCCWAGTLHH
jgi:hypothetical protein